jgi:aryl-alcohol dehydrogenase-like predicted oxidoreductase
MKQRVLGSSGLEVSVLGLGTMTFGNEANEATSHAILDRYFDAGGTFVDTADVYTRGVSEEYIGRWLSDRGVRDEVVVATKARFAMSDDPGDRGAGRGYLQRALDASLRRLGVDHVDLYQIHAWDPNTPVEETMEALNGFVEAGKVRFVGVSNYLGWQVERAVQASERNGWAPVISLQPQYNLLARDIELELVPLCIDRGIGLLPWSPLGGGWLTGKYQRDIAPTPLSRLGEDPTRGLEAYSVRNTERTWSILDVVRSIAGRRGTTMSQVAVNWLRRRPMVSSVLLGCRTTAQLDENLAALKWDLTDDEITDLNEVSAPGIPAYPQGFLENEAGMDIWKTLETRIEKAY